ncbi:MAG: twin-arginine translocation signal domain-containing protein [Deltaproteobacteria bacterium]|nr:twin-arginine translocation signal domain-containing protein [Deltaproteobacteria bacterium]
MKEKNTNATKAYHSKTDRRDFLKTGVAFAGAALLGGSV